MANGDVLVGVPKKGPSYGVRGSHPLPLLQLTATVIHCSNAFRAVTWVAFLEGSCLKSASSPNLLMRLKGEFSTFGDTCTTSLKTPWIQFEQERLLVYPYCATLIHLLSHPKPQVFTFSLSESLGAFQYLGLSIVLFRCYRHWSSVCGLESNRPAAAHDLHQHLQLQLGQQRKATKHNI